jgi:spore maturation protein CgeB
MPKLDVPAPGARVFTYRKANVEGWRSAGFEHVDYMPLASDPAQRRRLSLSDREREIHGAWVGFVGSSMVEQATRCRRRFVELHEAWQSFDGRASEPADDRLRAVLDAQRADNDKDRMPELLEEAFGDLLAAHRELGYLEDPVILASEVAAAEKRLNWVAALGRFGIQVWGDEGWRMAETCGARYRGPAGHGDQLTRIYNATDIQVDVARLYQHDIVTMRVFDVLACGGFILAAHSEALEECFELGVEVASYRNLAELQEKIAYYLEHDDEARAIAELGQAAVLERHSIGDRLGLMIGAAPSG